VCLGYRLNDCKPQSSSASGAFAARVRASEALEDATQLIVRHPGARVGDNQLDVPVVSAAICSRSSSALGDEADDSRLVVDHQQTRHLTLILGGGLAMHQIHDGIVIFFRRYR
jgi:hypothetical protein